MGYDVDAEGRVKLAIGLVEPPTSISPEARAFLATSPFGEAPPTSGEPIPMWVMRDHVDQQMAMLSQLALDRYPVEVEEISIAGVRCHLVKPKEIPPENAGKALMNLHGGGFVLGSGSLVEAIPIAHLAKIPVVAVDYRLAPEHPYPAAVDDALAVYRAMLGYHAPGALGVYGSSAGGFLTAQLMERLKREGLPLPACCGVFTAGGDLSDFGDTAQIFTLMGFWGEPILPHDHPASEIRAYVGGVAMTDPAVSPARGDLSGFPPTLLMAGTRDALLSATANFHRALRRAQVEAELYVFDAMPHAHWYMLHVPEAQEAAQAMASFFLKHLGAGGGRQVAPERLEALAREAVQLISAFDAEKFRARFTEDAVLEFPFAGPGMPARFEGGEAAAAALAGAAAFFETIEVQVEAAHVSPSTAAVLLEARGRGRLRNGRDYQNRYVFTFRFDGERIALWREYFDPQKLPGAERDR